MALPQRDQLEMASQGLLELQARLRHMLMMLRNQHPLLKIHPVFQQEKVVEVDGDHSERQTTIQTHRNQGLVVKDLDQAEMTREITGEAHLGDRSVEVVIQIALLRR